MIYEALIGPDFHKLHPKLKERYEIGLGDVFEATGVMEVMRSGPTLMKPVYYAMTLNDFLIPESGTDIPFTLKYWVERFDGRFAEVIWERVFYFPEVTRTFTTNMKIDTLQQTGADYLGSPAVFSSNVQFDVTKDGLLLMRSLDQHIVLGTLEIPVPQQLAGRGVVIEGYDEEREAYTIEVSFTNSAGPLVMYKGTFQSKK